MSIKRIGLAAGKVIPQKRVLSKSDIDSINNILANSKKDIGGTAVALKQIGGIVRDVSIRYAKRVTPIKDI